MLPTIHMQTKLERSRKRLSSCNPATLQEHVSPAKCTRMTRWNLSLFFFSLANFPTRNERVLPLVCITCQRHKYEKNKNCAWVKVNLVTCEGDGQKLLELAERRHDEKIILHVRVRAYLSSAEVRYHKSIYRNYTRDSSIAKDKEHLKETTDVVFEQFSTDVIAGNLYQDQKVSCISKLHEICIQFQVWCCSRVCAHLLPLLTRSDNAEPAEFRLLFY